MQYRNYIAVFILLIATAVLIQAHEETPEPPHWMYEGEEGPNVWGELDESFALCGTGEAQSPIDLTGAQSINLTGLTMNYAESKLNIFNNGHTIQVNYDEGSTLVYNEIEYALLQFHFHHPSEHTVDGETFPMELHFVHRSADGDLAVVGVMLDETEEDNAEYVAIFENLPTEKGDPQATELTINAADLMPQNSLYTTYIGSLTTPPCSQGVRWLVLQEPVPLSAAQIETFGEIFELNARPVQPLNERDLLADRE